MDNEVNNHYFDVRADKTEKVMISFFEQIANVAGTLVSKSESMETNSKLQSSDIKSVKGNYNIYKLFAKN